MTYGEATKYLYGLVDYEKTPAQTATSLYLNLDRMYYALDRAGNPHLKLRCVHIAGTKGKGSTAAMTASILRAAGLRVGLFTSPHLVDFRERMRINNDLIDKETFAGIVEEIRPIIEEMRGIEEGAPTFFEAYTLLAFLWFSRSKPDIVVLETGMGGRLDATNVVQPLVTAITTLALDHQAELGDTLAAIAGEKAGIIKPGVPVVSAPQEPEAAEVIARVAGEKGILLVRVGEEITSPPTPLLRGEGSKGIGQWFTIVGRLGTYDDLFCPLLGEHQQINAAVALGIIECLKEVGINISADNIRSGIASVDWPGRLQIVRECPLLIFDGAHDPASIDAMLAALNRHFPNRRRVFILGFSGDKDWPAMLRQLVQTSATAVLTAAPTPRAAKIEDMVTAAKEIGLHFTTAPNVAAAIEQALTEASPEDMIVVTGSLYIVGEALKWEGVRR